MRFTDGTKMIATQTDSAGRGGRTLAAALAFVLMLAVVPVVVPPHAQAATYPSAEQQFVQLINHERTSRGLAALTVAPDVRAVARNWSARMASERSFYHNPRFSQEICCWSLVTENIAWWTSTSVSASEKVAVLHDGLMNSPGHRANILDERVTEVGIGVWYGEIDGSPAMYVTQNFRRPDGTPPPDVPDDEIVEPDPPTPTPSPTPAPSPTTLPPTPDAPSPAQPAPPQRPDPRPTQEPPAPESPDEVADSPVDPETVEVPATGPITRSQLLALVGRELRGTFSDLALVGPDHDATRIDLLALFDWGLGTADERRRLDTYVEGAGRTDLRGYSVRLGSVDLFGSFGGGIGSVLTVTEAVAAIEEVRAMDGEVEEA